tara:strand:- start:395 stop:532 length:138 start_codon:yes stop_codon:yes gene_type:complete
LASAAIAADRRGIVSIVRHGILGQRLALRVSHGSLGLGVLYAGAQ